MDYTLTTDMAPLRRQWSYRPTSFAFHSKIVLNTAEQKFCFNMTKGVPILKESGNIRVKLIWVYFINFNLYVWFQLENVI
jgi:hypothetical protein